MVRIEKKFRELRREAKKAFIPFITAGDPSLAKTRAYVLALAKGGADIIELGVPFSDPMADGPVIQAADERALKKKTDLKGILSLVKSLRREIDIPIVLMGYYNPIFRFGVERFARSAVKHGVDGCLIADLPPEEATEVAKPFTQSKLDLVYLLAPTSDGSRIKRIVRMARGYLYYVSLTGITGAKLADVSQVKGQVKKIQQQTKLPVAVGFGIATPQAAAQVARFSDGVIVGSAFVRKIASGASASQLETMAQKFNRAIKSV